jgi:hypothetical protein
MLCSHALELLVHGSTPQTPPLYPTADESRELHEYLKKAVIWATNEAVKLAGGTVVSMEPEYEHRLGIKIGDSMLCANSKADLVYTVKFGRSLVTLYVEATTRIHAAKPWQALLRGIALYYERSLPVWIIIASPNNIQYKLLEDRDQDKILRSIRGGRTPPSPNTCSLCELAHFCPYRAV